MQPVASLEAGLNRLEIGGASGVDPEEKVTRRQGCSHEDG